MSMDFTFSMVGPAQSLRKFFVSTETTLKKNGFRTASHILRAGLDERGVFDEEDEDEDIILSNNAVTYAKELEALEGFSVEFLFPDGPTLYMIACNYGGQSLYVYIDMSHRSFLKILGERGVQAYLEPIGIIAQCASAYGGFGDLELCFEPFPPQNVISNIFYNPGEGPAVIGLIPYEKMNEALMRRPGIEAYDIMHATPGFFGLVEKDVYDFLDK